MDWERRKKDMEAWQRSVLEVKDNMVNQMTFHDEQDILYFFFVFWGYGVKDDPVLIWFWLFYTLWYGFYLFKRRLS